MDKWNSTNDSFPTETNKCYLVYCEGNQCQFTAQVDRATGKWHLWTFGPSERITNQVCITHWREMPKGPTK